MNLIDVNNVIFLGLILSFKDKSIHIFNPHKVYPPILYLVTYVLILISYNLPDHCTIVTVFNIHTQLPHYCILIDISYPGLRS